MKYKLALFDMDGTILDTLEDLTDATNVIMEKYGYPTHGIDAVRTFVGNGAERLIALSLPGKENDPPVAEVLAVYQKYYKAHSQIKTKPYHGIPEQLAKISGKFPMAIVSNKPDAPVKLLCADYFPGVYALGETADCPRKPAPDMVYKAMGVLGVEKCIYVATSTSLSPT